MKFCIYPVLLILLSACERYQVTLNTQPVYTPPQLFSDYRIPDAALNNCVRQTVQENKITRPGDLLSLNCSYAGITNLEGLEVFTHLQIINMSSNRLEEIKPLLFLGYLQQVNLRGNPNLYCPQLGVLMELSAKVESPDHCR